jgi:hypothetical protein
MKASVLLLGVALGGGLSATGVERWGVFEITLPGAASARPYLDVSLSARFTQGDQRILVPGFWESGDTYATA